MIYYNLKVKTMNEAQNIIGVFLEELKQSLFENCNYIADQIILKNNISDTIKLVNKTLNEQFTIIENDSQQKTDKNEVIKNFETQLINKIEKIIKDKCYLQSRIYANKNVPNTLDIKKIVEKFSANYFLPTKTSLENL